MINRAVAAAALLTTLVATAAGCAGSTDEDTSGSADAIRLFGFGADAPKSPIAEGLYTDGTDAYLRVVGTGVPQAINWQFGMADFGYGAWTANADHSVSVAAGRSVLTLVPNGNELTVDERKNGAPIPPRAFKQIGYASLSGTRNARLDPSFHVTVAAGVNGGALSFTRDGDPRVFRAFAPYSRDRFDMYSTACTGIRYELSLNGKPYVVLERYYTDATDCSLVAELYDATKGFVELE